MNDFKAVGLFHEKFNLPTVKDGPPRFLDLPTEQFRTKFIEEELREFKEGLEERDLPKAADSLVDMVYVILGTCHMMGIPWPALFAEVQRANMTKERCGINHRYENEIPISGFCGHPLDESTVCGKSRDAHSIRGSALDVIKPEGWTPPNVIGVLMAAGWPGPELPLEEK